MTIEVPRLLPGDLTVGSPIFRNLNEYIHHVFVLRILPTEQYVNIPWENVLYQCDILFLQVVDILRFDRIKLVFQFSFLVTVFSIVIRHYASEIYIPIDQYIIYLSQHNLITTNELAKSVRDFIEYIEPRILHFAANSKKWKPI